MGDRRRARTAHAGTRVAATRADPARAARTRPGRPGRRRPGAGGDGRRRPRARIGRRDGGRDRGAAAAAAGPTAAREGDDLALRAVLERAARVAPEWDAEAELATLTAARRRRRRTRPPAALAWLTRIVHPRRSRS